MGQEIHVHLDGKQHHGTALALQILNAFYSALILKKMEGVEITPDVESDVLEAVCRRMTAIEKLIRLAKTVSKPKGSR